MITEFSSDYLLFHNQEDSHIIKKFHRDINAIANDNIDLALLIEYIEPPLDSVRYDGEITICLIRKSLVDKSQIDKFKLVQNLIYHCLYQYLNKFIIYNYRVVQLGKPNQKPLPANNLSQCSEIIIPHKGKLALLDRCVRHLLTTEAVNIPTKIIFDSYGYKSFIQSDLHKQHLTVYKNAPLAVGPYLGRHYTILQSNSPYFFLQDSDDISVPGRFDVQMNHLLEKKLDMVGCHELRIDQFSRTLKLVRFPLNVNRALQKKASHPLFHPTSLINRAKYIESGGFSLNRKFSSDTQYLLRAYFSMKIGNVDEFLYMRFNRPNSLTNNHVSNLKSEVRKSLDVLWKKDFEEIKSNRLDIEKSSLKVEKHDYVYNLIKIDYGF